MKYKTPSPSPLFIEMRREDVLGKNKKQATIFRSSAESEYKCLASTTYELIWVVKILKDLEVDGLLPTYLYCDSSSAISIAKNPVFHEKTKHFDIDLHLIREKVSFGFVKVLKVSSANNVADIFTKGLSIAQRTDITSLKCVLTQEHLEDICAKYFVPEEVHPQLPSSDATMHERPAGKVGMYTRFFDYANYRIPFSTFFVSVLTHFRIPFSQLSVFGSAKIELLPPSEYNVEHVNTLIAQASLFLRFPEEFLCWVGISRNYLLNKDTYPRFEYENGEVMNLNAFICTADPREVMIVERARAENERPIMTVAKRHTVTLLPTSVVRPSGELSASVEREFVGDASVDGGGDEEVTFIGGQDNVEPSVPITDNVGTKIPRPKRTKKKRVTRGSKRTPATSHPPKRLRADYGTAGGSATGGKSPSVLNRLLQDSRLMVEQGVPALPTLPFISSSVTASPLEEGGDHTDSVTGPSLRTIGPSARFVVLFDSSHHSGAKSVDPEVDSLIRSAVLVMTEATTMTTIAPTVAIPDDVGKDKSVPHPSVFGSSSSSEKTDRTLSFFTGRSGSGFAVGSIRAEEVTYAGLGEIYVPEWTVTKGFELNDGYSCANMIDHFTPPAFFKTVRGMEHEQLFAKSLAEEKDSLLGVKDKKIEELRSQLLKAKEESVAVSQLRARVSSLKAIEGFASRRSCFCQGTQRPS
ncbi:hypothetical protein Tco_0718377 [Tanacetum coccineum]